MARQRKGRGLSIKRKRVKEWLAMQRHAPLQQQSDKDRKWFESHPDQEAFYRVPVAGEFDKSINLVLVLAVTEGVRIRFPIADDTPLTHPATGQPTTARAVAAFLGDRCIKAYPDTGIERLRTQINRTRLLKQGIVSN